MDDRTYSDLLKEWAVARRAAQANAQALKTSQMQLAHTQPMADAAQPVAHIGGQALGWQVPSRAHHAAALVKVAWPELLQPVAADVSLEAVS